MKFGDPVYTLSGKAVNLIAEIAASLERYKIAMEGAEGVRLRKLNHIRTLRGTTAIEGNTLTEEEITVVRKGGKKTADRILDLVRANPRITFAEMVVALGISRSAIQKHVAHLKDAQFLRRIGPDKGGSWEVVKP